MKRVQLAETYLNEAALGDANADAISRGTFDGRAPAKAPPPAGNGAPRRTAAPPPARAAAPTPAAAPAAAGGALSAAALESKSLGELRALARSRGLRGDTKAELVKVLSGAPAAGAVANGAPKGAAAAAP